MSSFHLSPAQKVAPETDEGRLLRLQIPRVGHNERELFAAPSTGSSDEGINAAVSPIDSRNDEQWYLGGKSRKSSLEQQRLVFYMCKGCDHISY